MVVTGAPGTPNAAADLCLMLLKRRRHGRPRTPQPLVLIPRDHREQVEAQRPMGRVRYELRDRHSSPRAKLQGSPLRQPAVLVESEQVVARGDPDAAPRRQLHLVDPIGASLVPAGDLVIADLERLGIERNHRSRQSLAHDLADRTRLELAVEQQHHRLRSGQTRMNQEAEPAEARFSL
jgi:hypothetical protein